MQFVRGISLIWILVAILVVAAVAALVSVPARDQTRSPADEPSAETRPISKPAPPAQRAEASTRPAGRDAALGKLSEPAPPATRTEASTRPAGRDAALGELSEPAPPATRTEASKRPAGRDAALGKVIQLDDRFTVSGSGTEVDPLRITWDLLLSARESFDPAEKKDELPARVTLLNGQIVSITGYFAAGVLEDETTELLVMLNRWDGCCLGLPPTPYDAVEVVLAEPVMLRGKHMIRYGTVTGRFEVEPFVLGDFLVGLYRIQDARLDWGG